VRLFARPSLLALILPGFLAAAARAAAQEPAWLTTWRSLPVAGSGLQAFQGDPLVDPVDRRTGLFRNEGSPRTLILDNGLIRRTWVLEPDAACIALDLQAPVRSAATVLRAVRPEAELRVNGQEIRAGGLLGQPNHAWFDPAWLAEMRADPEAMRFSGFEILGPPGERLPWPRVRHHAPDVAWPPPGLHLRLDFEPRPGAASTPPGLQLAVHYEMYDGLPLMAKWLEVRNKGGETLEIDHWTVEILAVVESSNPVETREGVPLPAPDLLHVETDYAFGGFQAGQAMRHSVHWVPDPEYLTQVNYLRRTPCLLRVEPVRGPDRLLEPGERLQSFRAFELVQDSRERERRGLWQRRMYRALAPWVTENPLILHVVSVDPEVVRRAIDQAAECGFEMLSLSFGSGLNMEDVSPANLRRFRELADYARERGIELGGYSLLSSRRIGNGQDVVPPPGERPTHGSCPALTSEWGQDYFRRLRTFFRETGFRQFTHDGSYPGDFDLTPRPPLQRGLEDSQWAQWQVITSFYRDLRAAGVYLRVPDYYFFNGSNECGMGYRETNWSLPRDQQVLHTRQNIYDGTWEKTPSMGWMFVPLTQYHGGGAAATIEPLDEHLDHYRRMLQSNLAFGVQAVYRGHRLYDTPRVRDMVREQVAWFKEHRDILESDLLHGRRADGRNLDWMLHVNPRLEKRAMLVVFNPQARVLSGTLDLDLSLAGLWRDALLEDPSGPLGARSLDCGRLRLPVRVPARGMTWVLFRAPAREGRETSPSGEG